MKFIASLWIYILFVLANISCHKTVNDHRTWNITHYHSLQMADINKLQSMDLYLPSLMPKRQYKQLKVRSSMFLLIILCGDVSINPGPRTPKFPCGLCHRPVTKHCEAIQCDHCDLWIHNKCSGIQDATYKIFMEQKSLTFICPSCHVPSFLQNISTGALVTSNRFQLLSSIDTTQSSIPSVTSPTSFRPAPFATSSPVGRRYHIARSTAKQLRVMSVNCNSLQSVNKRAELISLLEQHDPHIILGQESKLGDEHLSSEIFPPHYLTVRNDRKSGGGGVFVMVKENIDYNEDAISVSKTDCEIAWVQIKLPGTQLLNVASVYRPPSSAVAYMSKLRNHITEIYSKFPRASYIIGGDLNLPQVDWTTDSSILDGHGSLLRDTMDELGLSQHCLKPTRPESNNILDLIFTNRPCAVIDIEVLPGMSDHNIVLASFNLTTRSVQNQQRLIQKFNKADWDAIRKDAEILTKQYFDSDPNKRTVAENCHLLENGIRNIISEKVPTKRARRKSSYPWITPEVKRHQRRRDRLYVKAVKTRSPEAWLKFKKERQTTKDLIRTSHRNYISNYIGDAIQEDPRPFWSYIKSLRKDQSKIPSLNPNSETPAHSDRAKANALVEQFTSVFTVEDTNTVPNLEQKFPDMPTITFGEEGIKKLLCKVKPRKAGGPDDIPARFLQETATQMARPYTHLFQQSYNSGQVPQTWTHALVCPIYKNGPASTPENYRPVSLTAIPCKIFEHVIVSKIWEHLNEHMIVTSKQHGFRSGMSCETQLIEALFDWTSVLNKGQGQVDVAVLDFSKAFDTVPHERLLAKLHSYGIGRETSRWVKAFLTSRTHEVVVNGSKSEKHRVTSGVPQGSVLGPLLFLLYINDIEEGISSTIRLFADDSALYREIKSEEDTIKLQEDLFKLQEWANVWQMKFNVKKCKILRITRRTKNKTNYRYVMSTPTAPSEEVIQPQIQRAATDILKTVPANQNFSPLKEVEYEKYLGVIIDNKLNFNHHVEEITKKATRLLNLCRRNLYMCPAKVKEAAVKSIVRPQLEYASPAWNPYTAKNIDRVEAVQRRAARFVLGNYIYGPESRLTEQIGNILKWPSLQHRRAAHDLMIFYKVKRNLINIPLPETLRSSPIHPGRFLHLQTLNSDAFRFSFFPRTVRLWNLLPTSAVSAPTVDTFKARSTKFLYAKGWARVNNIWTLI